MPCDVAFSNGSNTLSPESEEQKKQMKYILVTGGVISGVGKGIISSSLGVLLKNNGYRVTTIKIDPYLNEDAGTFSPYEHGEVYVLDDGGEVDLDLGNYERFLNVHLTSDNNITSGKINKLINVRERRGDYCGKTVQMVPYKTNAISDWVKRVAAIPVDGTTETPDVCIIELGGTIGDDDGRAFVSAFARFQRPSMRDHFMNVHVSLILTISATGEQKTKPMQNSIREMRSSGLVPDLVICRSNSKLEQHLRHKIAEDGILDEEQVIGVHDVSNIYKVPLLLQEQGVLEAIQKTLHLPEVTEDIVRSLKFNMSHWANMAKRVDDVSEEVTIVLCGKYTKLTDAYASVNKALSHSAVRANRKLVLKYVNSEHLEKGADQEEYNAAWEIVRKAGGIIIPGGFGKRGVEGMINAAQYARENKVPFLGVCLGMQCAAIEVARNVLGIEKANSTEFDEELEPRQQIVISMPEHNVDTVGLGGTMRLGKRSTVFLTEKCMLRQLYNEEMVEERHRHRYEVNPSIVPELSRAGLLFVGMGVDESAPSLVSGVESKRTESSDELMKYAAEHKEDIDLLDKIDYLCQRGGDGVVKTAVRMEMIEMKDHPYFVGAQFHPEYLSHPLQPSPPFLGLLLAASGQLEAFLSSPKTFATTEMPQLKEEKMTLANGGIPRITLGALPNGLM